MNDKTKLNEMLNLMEAYVGSWQQLNQFINVARAKKFGREDEKQFLEVKSLITQQLELVLSRFQHPMVNREDTHMLMTSSASMRTVSELSDRELLNIEKLWHKNFISLQTVVGQLKARQKQLETQSFWSSLFSR